MLLICLSVLATILTVLRSWPQFIRIVAKGDGVGVSALTWTLALANHSGWLTFAVLADVPLLMLTNFLAAVGCAAIVWKVRSANLALLTITVASVLAALVFQLGESVLLVAINATAIAMFVPQAIRVLRTGSEGVSTAAWGIAALASMSWIAWGFVLERPTLVVAHFVMLPTSLVIAAISIQPVRPTADLALD